MRADLFAGVLPFVRTAEERSFGRAAARLGISTAAVSKAVQRLERELDIKLLERSSRVVRLTRDGETFFRQCRQAVLDVQGAREAVQGSRREPRGELAITIPFVVAPLLVPRFARLAEQHPGLAFRVQVTDRIARLSDEGIDVAIRIGELRPSSLIARVLRRPRWVTVASPGYLAHRPPPVVPAELAAHNCLRFLGIDGKPRDYSFLIDGEPTTVAVAGNLLIEHGTHLLDAARAGLGICQVLDFMVESELDRGTLVEVLAGAAAPGPAIHAVTTTARSRSPNVRVFLAFLTDLFRPV